jgi:hypothetical protein
MAKLKPGKCNRVVFMVRPHGLPDEEDEEGIINRFCDVLEEFEGWGILTVGRQYYHDNGQCSGHADSNDDCTAELS